MKIALVSTHATSEEGVPHYVSNLARAMARHHEVTIFSQTFEEMEDTGVRHRTVESVGGVASFGDVSAVDSEEFDIIHSHDYEYPFVSDVLTSHYCEQEGVDRIVVHGALTLSANSPAIRQSHAKARIETKLLASHDGNPLIVLSHRMKDEFVRHYEIPAKQIFVVHSGVDADKYSPRNVPLYRHEVRQRHGVGTNEPLLLLAGGDWERKGVAEAIEALSILDSKEAKLLIAGWGDARAYGQLASDMGVRDRVIFVGRTREAWKYYAASDLFLLPTHYEAFGLAILEAMATGLPILVSCRTGAAELIHDGIDGLLIQNPRDVPAISATLGALLKDADLRTRLGRQARLTALHHTWDRVARETEEVYERVLLEKRGRVEGQPLSPGDETEE